MSKKKLSNVFSVLICLMLITNILTIKVNAQTENVQLYCAQMDTVYGDYGRIKAYSTSGYIHINNMSSAKNVYVHYTYNGTDWLDAPASYLKTLEDGSEVWSYNTPKMTYEPAHQYNYYCQFAIRYEVGGNTYWDNNGGNDYYLRRSSVYPEYPYVLSKSYVKVTDSMRTEDGLYVYAKLQDLAYNKTVKLRFTTDNWQSYHEVDGTYTSSYGNGRESWFFDTKKCGVTLSPLDTGEYVVSYTVNGVTYWDNNFGSNYTFESK
ncbi:MAG: CBM21 domain-containing protein [Vallitalea sp.]|nr:CBM21 domain-containing protein [Vallitalea sp.]